MSPLDLFSFLFDFLVKNFDVLHKVRSEKKGNEKKNQEIIAASLHIRSMKLAPSHTLAINSFDLFLFER